MPGSGTHTTIIQHLAQENPTFQAALGDPTQTLNWSTYDNIEAVKSRYSILGAMGPDIFYAMLDYGPGIQTLEDDLIKILGTFKCVADLNSQMSNLVDKTANSITFGVWGDIESTVNLLKGIIIDGILDAALDKHNLWSVFLPRRQVDDYKQNWYWGDFLHYVKTGCFTTKLLDMCPTYSTDPTIKSFLKAYSLGYATHYVADTVGHAYVNRIVESPWRNCWQRHHFVENFIDAYVWDHWHNTSTVAQGPADEQGLDDILDKTIVDDPSRKIGDGAPLHYARLNDLCDIGGLGANTAIDAAISSVCESIEKGLFDWGLTSRLPSQELDDPAFITWTNFIADAIWATYPPTQDHPQQLSSPPGTGCRDGYPTPDDVAGAYGAYRLVLSLATEDNVDAPVFPDIIGDISKILDQLWNEINQNLGNIPPPPSVSGSGGFSFDALWDAIKRYADWLGQVAAAVIKTVGDIIAASIELLGDVLTEPIKVALWVLNSILFALYHTARMTLVMSAYSVPLTEDLTGAWGPVDLQTLWKTTGVEGSQPYPIEPSLSERDLTSDPSHSSSPYRPYFRPSMTDPVNVEWPPTVAPSELLKWTTPDDMLEMPLGLGTDAMLSANGPAPSTTVPLPNSDVMLKTFDGSQRYFGGIFANCEAALNAAIPYVSDPSVPLPEGTVLPDYNLDSDRGYAWPCWDVDYNYPSESTPFPWNGCDPFPAHTPALSPPRSNLSPVDPWGKPRNGQAWVNATTLDAAPNTPIVSQGTVTLKGTYLFDLDAGVQSVMGGVLPGADIWWDVHVTGGGKGPGGFGWQGAMTPQNSAGIINLGAVEFGSLTCAYLQTLAYATTPIVGNSVAATTNKLVNGDVFAVQTTNGNYVKVLVVTEGSDIVIQWLTYAPCDCGYADIPFSWVEIDPTIDTLKALDTCKPILNPVPKGSQLTYDYRTAPTAYVNDFPNVPGDFVILPDGTQENDGRLHDFLRNQAKLKDPLQILANAVTLCLKGFVTLDSKTKEHVEPPTSILVGGMDALVDAVAQLAVTGRVSFEQFEKSVPQVKNLVAEVGTLNPDIIFDPVLLEATAGSVLDTAYTALWAIRGNDPGWRDFRSKLVSKSGSKSGWIAVSGFDDTPHRPVNVPTAPYPQFDITWDFKVDGKPFHETTRYMVASAHTFIGPNDAKKSSFTVPADPDVSALLEPFPPVPPAVPFSPTPAPRTVPQDIPNILPENKIIIYIHGGGSRAEEAVGLANWLIYEGAQGGNTYTVISFDLPNSAYATPFDVADVVASPYDPFVLSILLFEEQYVTSFIDALVLQKVLKKDQIVAVMGGSLGGNMSLLLSGGNDASHQSLNDLTVHPYLKTIVAWSVTAAAPSAFMGIVPNKWAGVYIAHLQKGATNSEGTPPQDHSMETEYIHHLYFDPLSPGYVGIVPPIPPDPIMWFRGADDWQTCKKASIAQSRFDRYEIYSEYVRHWANAIDLEQISFSFQDDCRYRSIAADPTARLLLAAGDEDNFDPVDIFNSTIDVARLIRRTAHGKAEFWSNTGHSVHSERPRLFAREIVYFLTNPDASGSLNGAMTSPQRAGPSRTDQ